MSRVRNPRKSKSEESYERFHDAEPVGWKKIQVPALPKKAWKLGKLTALVYEPENPSKKARVAYEHQFGDGGLPGGTLFFDKNQPVLYASEDGKQLIIVRGKSRYYVDASRGIMW